MKRFISFAVVIAMLFAMMPFTIFAETNNGLSFELSNDGAYYIVTFFNGSATEVVIPSTYNGLPVKEIDSHAFFDCGYNIKSVEIPDSITLIGYCAFRQCNSLTSIKIPSSVVAIEESAFSACRHLKHIYCEAQSQPSGWESGWYEETDAIIHWGYVAGTEEPETPVEFAGGNGTKGSPYLIETKEQLANVREFRDVAYFKLISDIEFSASDFAKGGDFYNNGAGFAPIGKYSSTSFRGVFDGDGHVIKNIYINIESDTYDIYAGLFGYNEGTVKNLGMIDGSVNANTTEYGLSGYAGGIVAYNDDGTIENCYNTGSVTAIASEGHPFAGGIVASNGGTIKNCYNLGSVVSVGPEAYSGNAGGIAGSNGGTIEDCYNKGDVEILYTYSYIGGIIGYNGGTVENCYNEGNISLESYCEGNFVGGIVGWNTSTISSCYNTGSMTANVGGDFGSASIGGVVGCNYKGKTSDCYNTGSVSVTAGGDSDANVGGVAGWITNGTVSNCYNIGTVSATTTGTASADVGGFAGGNYQGTINNGYYVDNTSSGLGGGNSGNTTKCTLEEMKQQSTFVGFNFYTTWTFDETNESYPYPVLRGIKVSQEDSDPSEEPSEEPSVEPSEEPSDEPSDEPIDPEFDIDVEMGEANADAKFDIVVEAPEYYRAGKELAVTVRIENITAENGVSGLNFVFKYDSEKLTLINDLLEDEECAVDCITNIPDKWENLISVAFTMDEETGIATPINNGIVTVNIGTAYLKNYAVADGDIELTFNFKVGEDVTEDIYTYVANKGIYGSANTQTGFDNFTGNGSYAVSTKLVLALGDVDGNKLININDYIMVRRSVMGTYTLSAEQFEAADVNGDDNINMMDYIAIRRHVMGTFVLGS